jgi:hypothetical protein
MSGELLRFYPLYTFNLIEVLIVAQDRLNAPLLHVSGGQRVSEVYVGCGDLPGPDDRKSLTSGVDIALGLPIRPQGYIRPAARDPQ